MRLYLPLIIFIYSLAGNGINAQLVITASPVNGCDTLIVQFGLEPASGIDTIQSITWDFGNSTTITGSFTPEMEYNSPGTYTVTCLINNLTTLTSDNLIEVRKGPLAIFSSSDTLTSGSLSRFFSTIQQPVATNTYLYNWEFSDGSTYFTPSFIHTFPETGLYNVLLTITDQTGCTDTILREVTAGNLVEVPNVFSPNGDDINDYLLIRTNGINVFSLDIYTRSGVLVYKSESPYLIWDGRSMSGHEMNQGIYFYVVKQVDGETELQKSGFIHLLR